MQTAPEPSVPLLLLFLLLQLLLHLLLLLQSNPIPGFCSLINAACTRAYNCLHLQCHTQWLVVSLMLQTNTQTSLTIYVYVCVSYVVFCVFVIMFGLCLVIVCAQSSMPTTLALSLLHQLADHTSTLVCVRRTCVCALCVRMCVCCVFCCGVLCLLLLCVFKAQCHCHWCTPAGWSYLYSCFHSCLRHFVHNPSGQQSKPLTAGTRANES